MMKDYLKDFKDYLNDVKDDMYEIIDFIRHWYLNRTYRKSDFGRNYGWYVEYKGKVVGELINPVYTDMFWVSYLIVPLDENDTEVLYSQELWSQSKFKFRNKKYPVYAENAFAGGSNIDSDGRIQMRGLYIYNA